MIPRLVLVACLGTCAAATAAQGFPSRPVRMIVPLAAGGPVDIVARIISARLAEQWGQQVIVDNRPGAGGSVGGELVARAQPNGYTLLLASNGTLAIAPHLLKLPYDARRDLAPVARLGTSPQALVTPPAFAATHVKELIALARAKPGSINFASSGPGSTSHLASELFKAAARIEITHVPYKGAGPALNDLIAGQTQMMITGVSSVLPHARGGRLRVLGVTSARRIPALPDAPAIAETVPGYEVTTWYGILCPRGTPAAVVRQLHEAAVRAVEHPDVRARLTGAGVDPETGSPAEFAALISAETEKWGKLIKAAGIQAQ